MTNRHYEIVPQPVTNIAVLKKIADDDRNWDHFREFEIGKTQNSGGTNFRKMLLKLARRAGTDKVLRHLRS
jgi:hypothetical protein